MSRALAVLSLVLLTLPLLAVSSPAPSAPSFNIYPAPSGVGNNAGEPSIGVDWNTGKVLYLAGLDTLRVNFDSAHPANANWFDVTFLMTGFTSEDPILFTDSQTGRTFVSQLLGTCSLMAYTDDDGSNWVPTGGCGVPSGFDHQAVGGGPFAAPLVGTPVYEHAVYYCAQEALAASCAQSQDGGLTFGPSVPMYALNCIGLHGHPRVAPDGTVYVPNMDCANGEQGVAVSANNGIQWAIRTVPGSTTRDKSDPSVAAGSAGRAYFCYADGDGHARAVSSTDQGRSWNAPSDLGAAFNLQNTEIPAVIAGDDLRAACAFLGTPTAGDDQASGFQGVWHLYVSFTYDGGATWETVDATPTDPVQRGCIWMQGGGNACRNLLDFMDITVDAWGRVLVGFADGCVSATCIGPSGGPGDSRASKATIARQASGTIGLFAAHDPLP
ncbi:MAG: glycoside hydrolase [Halobacteriales archaeon]|nr:glycoside hydrolase [Halobacteriales archaeon]